MVLFIVSVPMIHKSLMCMPPPEELAELPDKVQLLTVIVPMSSMPAPTLAVLSDRVQLLLVIVPAVSMPPPSVAELSARVQLLTLLTVSVAVLLQMPPPVPPAELCDRVLSLIVSVPK